MALLSAAMAGINAGGAYMFAAWSVSSLVASHPGGQGELAEMHDVLCSRALILEGPDRSCGSEVGALPGMQLWVTRASATLYGLPAMTSLSWPLCVDCHTDSCCL